MLVGYRDDNSLWMLSIDRALNSQLLIFILKTDAMLEVCIFFYVFDISCFHPTTGMLPMCRRNYFPLSRSLPLRTCLTMHVPVGANVGIICYWELTRRWLLREFYGEGWLKAVFFAS